MNTPAASVAPLGPCIALAGPTACGKSEWALRLAANWPIEIVSVDSAQVYRGLDVGTAKPDLAVRARVPHHLIDLRDPAGHYSAGDFQRDARVAIQSIRARGAIPLLVGGTMLYFRALFGGLAELPRRDPARRARLDARAAERGWPALHAELARLDPAAAARIHPNDAQRIQRALEVIEATGRPLTSALKALPAPAGADVLRFALLPADRRELRRRIEVRFADMLRRGLLEEVHRLAARPELTGCEPALRVVGYRQLLDAVRQNRPIDVAIDRAVTATYQLAKRQMTWIRGEAGWLVLDPFAPGAWERFFAEVATVMRLSPWRPEARASMGQLEDRV